MVCFPTFKPHEKSCMITCFQMWGVWTEPYTHSTRRLQIAKRRLSCNRPAAESSASVVPACMSILKAVRPGSKSGTAARFKCRTRLSLCRVQRERILCVSSVGRGNRLIFRCDPQGRPQGRPCSCTLCVSSIEGGTELVHGHLLAIIDDA